MFDQPIFASPRWFRLGSTWGTRALPVPVDRRGYAYLGLAGLAAIVPVALLELLHGDHITTGIWLLFVLGTMTVDLVGLSRSLKRKADEDVLYIRQDEQSEVAYTPKYELRGRVG